MSDFGMLDFTDDAPSFGGDAPAPAPAEQNTSGYAASLAKASEAQAKKD